MKRSMSIIASLLVLILAMLSSAWAVETIEEKNLQKEATEINATAGTEKGEQMVVQRLEKEFSVTDTEIQALRDRKLGYGEIAIVFSMTQKLGGITDANISRIIGLREGPPVMGWGEIAKKLDIKLGATLSQVEKLSKETGKDMGIENKGKGLRDEMTGHESMNGMSHGKGR
jgi:hypothetical protein